MSNNNHPKNNSHHHHNNTNRHPQHQNNKSNTNTTTTNHPSTQTAQSRTGQSQPQAKSPLTDAIDHVDAFVQQLNATSLPGVMNQISAIHAENDEATFEQATAFRQSLQHYGSILRQERAAATKAEAHGTSVYDVSSARDDLENAHKKAQEYKSYRDQEQREVDAIQHQIHAIEAGINEEYDEDGEGFVFDSELAQLEEELSTLSAKLDIYQRLSHITFPQHNPNPNNSGSRGNSSNIVTGYATLSNLGDIRPFEIDLDATPANQIHDLIWGWLYDEHCPQH